MFLWLRGGKSCFFLRLYLGEVSLAHIEDN